MAASKVFNGKSIEREAGDIFGTVFATPLVASGSASLSYHPTVRHGKNAGRSGEVIHISTAIHKRKRSKKKTTTMTAILASRTHVQNHIRS